MRDRSACGSRWAIWSTIHLRDARALGRSDHNPITPDSGPRMWNDCHTPLHPPGAPAITTPTCTRPPTPWICCRHGRSSSGWQCGGLQHASEPAKQVPLPKDTSPHLHTPTPWLCPGRGRGSGWRSAGRSRPSEGRGGARKVAAAPRRSASWGEGAERETVTPGG